MKRILMVFCLSWLWTTGCALQQDVVTLDNRTLGLERQMRELDGKLSRLDTGLSTIGENKAKAEQNLRGQSAQIRATVGGLTEQVQSLRGRVEETDYQLRQQLAGLEKTLGLMDGRLKKLEGFLNVQEGQSQPTAAASTAARKPSGEEEILYDKGLQLFNDGRYAEARKTFSDFLQKFSKSDQADNAQFWIAETYYREQWLEKAILEYQKVIENYPRGNKVPASLLKQALAFADMGDNANAKLILEELIGKYPKSNEATVAKERVKKL